MNGWKAELGKLKQKQMTPNGLNLLPSVFSHTYNPSTQEPWQEQWCEFQGTQSYTMRYKPIWDIEGEPVAKYKNKQEK